MKTYQFEACQNSEGQGACNWGKFLVGVLDEEWNWRSEVDGGRPLLHAIGWYGPQNIWVADLQTGEGCFVRPGGSAHADLEKHAVWVCPMFEPWLTWLYGQLHGHEDFEARLAELPRVVELPDAEFSFAGYRRPGPVR